MSDNNSGAAGPAADNKTTGGQPDYKALYEQALTDLETAQKRFTGLQRVYQGERAKWETDAGKLADLENQLKTFVGEKEKLALDLQSLTAKLEETAQTASKRQAELDRLKLIASSFPQLLPLEAEGLLPSDSGEALKAKLEKLAKTITAKGQAEAAALLKGSAPASPPAAKTDNPEELKKAAFAAQKAGKVDDYNRLMDDYFRAINPKS